MKIGHIYYNYNICYIMTQPSILLINKNKIIEKNKIVEQLKKEIIKQNLIKQEQLTIKQESDINKWI